jgi:hypothetical protein
MSVVIKHPPKRDFVSAVELAMYATRQEVLEDCRFFCRRDTGRLIESGNAEMAGDNKAEIVITFNTPYAARVYFTGVPSHDKNPHASLKWCQQAEMNYGDKWKRHIEKRLSKALGG